MAYSESLMYLLGFVETHQYVQALEYFMEEADRYHEQNTPTLEAMYENNVKQVWRTIDQVDGYYGTEYRKAVQEALAAKVKKP